MNHTLEDHLNMIHTTEKGALRIRRNLGLQESDICAWCRSMILNQDACIDKRGKNWYVMADGCKMTVNASSYTVITAHRISKNDSAPPGRPSLDRYMDAVVFREYYFLKSELIAFCHESNLPASGNKQQLTERIAFFLETGKTVVTEGNKTKKHKKRPSSVINGNSIIEDNFVCSEKHRAFFKQKIGNSFSFNVLFQQWLKANAGKTYDDAVSAYHEIMKEKKKIKSRIGKQFEYNAYIRDFFADNPGKTLDEAIRCWKFRKGLKGHNRYECSDLSALE